MDLQPRRGIKERKKKKGRREKEWKREEEGTREAAAHRRFITITRQAAQQQRQRNEGSSCAPQVHAQ